MANYDPPSVWHTRRQAVGRSTAEGGGADSGFHPGELWHTPKREQLTRHMPRSPAHAERPPPAAASRPAARAGGHGPWGRPCHRRCELPSARVGATPASARWRDAPLALRAVLTLLPADTFVERPLAVMQVVETRPGPRTVAAFRTEADRQGCRRRSNRWTGPAAITTLTTCARCWATSLRPCSSKRHGRRRKPTSAASRAGAALAKLAVPGAAQGVALQRHQAFRGEADHLAKEARVGALLQKLAEGDLVIGHRGGPWVRVASCNPTLPSTAAVATAVDKSPAYARLSTVASAGDLPTAPTPHPGARPIGRVQMDFPIFGNFQRSATATKALEQNRPT